MHKIIEATYELIDELDNSDIIKNITFYRDRIKNNLEVCSLIEKSKNTDDKYIIMDIRRKLYSNSDYKNYIDSYNQLYYIVMNINKRLNKLVNNRRCGGCRK
jgi:hypothetical protein